MRMLVLQEFGYTLPDAPETTHTASPGEWLDVESPDHVAALISDGRAQLEQQPQAASMGPQFHLAADPIHVTAADVEKYGKEQAFSRAIRAHEERQG
jgi:hypothetical protein